MAQSDTQRTESLIKSINTSLMEQEFPIVRTCYIDLVTIKDLRMGLFLALSQPEDISYLTNGLPRWNMRPQRTFTLAYPEWRYTETEMEQMYHDPSRADAIFTHAPDTVFSSATTSLMTQLQSGNNRAGYTEPIMITINSWPLPTTGYVPVFQHMYGDYLGNEHFTVRSISVDPAQLPVSLLQSTDLFVFDSIHPLTMETSPAYEPLLKKQSYLNKMIYAGYHAEDTVLNQWKEEGMDIWKKEDQELRFELTALYMSMCCQFAYCHYPIPLEQPQS